MRRTRLLGALLAPLFALALSGCAPRLACPSDGLQCVGESVTHRLRGGF